VKTSLCVLLGFYSILAIKLPVAHTQKDHVWDYRSAVGVQRDPQRFWAKGCDQGQAGRSIMWAMARPLVLPRKRGNPNWGKPMEAAPDVPTAFEEQLQRLGLDEQTCVTSEKLKEWCEREEEEP